MKRTPLKRPSYEEALAKKRVQDAKRQEKRVQRQIEGKERKPRRTPKRLKNGELAQSEKTRRLKKKLWGMFSQYIRKSWADHAGYLTTVDGVVVHWKECDCGHLRHNSERNQQLGGNELWYYENNFAPQSNQGNRNNADDSAQKYMLWAIKKYGAEEVDKMFRMKETYRLWTFEELEAKYEYYKKKFEML